MHLLNCTGKAVPETSDYPITKLTRDTLKSKFNHLTDDFMTDDVIAHVLGCEKIYDLSDRIKITSSIYDTNTNAISPLEKELIFALTTLLMKVESGKNKELVESDSYVDLKENSLLVIKRLYTEEYDCIPALEIEVLNFFTSSLQMNSDFFECVCRIIYFINLVKWGEVTNTLYSSNNPNLYCKENLKTFYKSFIDRSFENLQIKGSRSKMVDLIHDISGSSAGAQADRPYLVKKNKTIEKSDAIERILFTVTDFIKEDTVNNDDPLFPIADKIKHMINTWELNSSPSIGELLGEDTYKEWISLNLAFAKSKINLSLSNPGSWMLKQKRRKCIKDIGAFLYLFSVKCQTKLTNSTSSRPSGSEIANMDAITQISLHRNIPKKISNLVAENYDYPMDGAELISEIARYNYIQFNNDEAGDFDLINDFVDNTIRDAERIWADIHPPRQEFDIGDEINDGVITDIYSYTPGCYLVKLHENKSNDDSTRRIIKFEHAEPC